MSSSMFKGLGRRFALLGALVALAVGAGASTAFASITPTEPGPYGLALPEFIEVVHVKAEGTAAEATHVALAECNVSGAPATWGQRCNINGAVGPTELDENGEATFNNFPVEWKFNDWDFTVQPPKPTGGTTVCKEEGEDQCALVASYYKPKAGGGFEQFHAEKEDIFFE